MNNLKMKKKSLSYIALTLLLVATMTLTACSTKTAGGESKSEVVAKVNDEVITKDDLYDALVEQNGAKVLDSLVMEKIMKLEGKAKNITIDPAKIDAEIEAVAENSGGMEGLETSLAMYGLNLESLKKNVEMNYLLEELLAPYADLSDDAISKHFEENKDNYGVKEQVKASHILVTDEALANELKEKADKGEDFAELAKEHSEDTGSKENGGELGFFGKGQMVAEFEEAAFAATVGSITEPVKSQFGYHIIKVEDKIDGEEAKLEDVKDKVRSAIIQESSQETYTQWYEEVISQYKIENLLNK